MAPLRRVGLRLEEQAAAADHHAAAPGLGAASREDMHRQVSTETLVTITNSPSGTSLDTVLKTSVTCNKFANMSECILCH